MHISFEHSKLRIAKITEYKLTKVFNSNRLLSLQDFHFKKYSLKTST